MNYTYILECSDKSLYTGWTTDLDKRLTMHNQGKGAKYTCGRRPVKLVYFEAFSTKEEAMKREYAIKQLSRREKQKLIRKNGLQQQEDMDGTNSTERKEDEVWQEKKERKEKR